MKMTLQQYADLHGVCYNVVRRNCSGLPHIKKKSGGYMYEEKAMDARMWRALSISILTIADRYIDLSKAALAKIYKDYGIEHDEEFRIRKELLERVEQILSDLGYKKMSTVKWLRVPDIARELGEDLPTLHHALNQYGVKKYGAGTKVSPNVISEQAYKEFVEARNSKPKLLATLTVVYAVGMKEVREIVKQAGIILLDNKHLRSDDYDVVKAILENDETPLRPRRVTSAAQQKRCG